MPGGTTALRFLPVASWSLVCWFLEMQPRAGLLKPRFNDSIIDALTVGPRKKALIGNFQRRFDWGQHYPFNRHLAMCGGRGCIFGYHHAFWHLGGKVGVLNFLH